MIAYQTSERHACRLMGLARSTQRYRRRRPERDAALRARLKKLAGKRMRFGYRRLTAVRVREGTLVNHKRVYRLYREEGLAMRIRERRRIRWNGRAASPAAERPNQRWSIDFVSDCVSTGKVIRMLTMVDDCTRECPAIEVDTSLGGLRVRQVLDRVAEERGLPEAIVLEPLSFSDSISSSWPARTFFHSGCDSNIGSGGCARNWCFGRLLCSVAWERTTHGMWRHSAGNWAQKLCLLGKIFLGIGEYCSTGEVSHAAGTKS